jgi:hypothetical protein
VRIVFCFQLALIFTGFLVWLGDRTQLVIYAYLGVYVLGLFICAYKDRTFWNRVKYVHIFALWLTIFHVWGFLVLDDQMKFAYESVRSYLRGVWTLYATATMLAGKKELRIYSNLLQWGVILNAIVSLLGYRFPLYYAVLVFNVKSLQNSENAGRFAGIFGNPNDAAFVFVTCIFFSVWANKRLAFAGRVAAVIALYLTYSRTSLYLMILALVVMTIRRMVLQWKAKDYRRVALTILKTAIVVATIAALFIVNWELISRDKKFQRFQNVTDKQAGYRGRLSVLSDSIELAMRQNWYGKGLFTFEHDVAELKPGHYIGAHNIYVLVFGEVGWPWLIVYVALLVYMTRMAWLRPKEGEDKFRFVLYCLFIWFVGGSWHNLFGAMHGVMMYAYMFYLPTLFAEPRKPRIAPPPEARGEAALVTE